MAAGMEVMFATAHTQFQGAGDAVVCCLHWNMVANGFKCIGQGEAVPQTTDGVKGSELLPSGWNADQNMYTLMYWPKGSTDTHLLKVVKMDATFLVHVMRIREEKIADMTVNIADHTTDDLSSFESSYKDLDVLNQRFNSEIMSVLIPQTTTVPCASRERQQQQRQPEPDFDPLRVGPPRRGGQPVPGWGQPSPPFGVGRGDLDPLAGGRGGGMFMDPSRFPGVVPDPDAGLPGRLPPGAVPPGARFDPFGPPGPDRSGGFGPRGGHRTGPDPDHLPPPGYDDMFM